jgi:DNA-binding transcriptional MerR regulator
MSTLQHIAQQQPEYDLDRFVEVTNDLLPQFLPDQATGSRGQEPVNPRLVRHYTTQGLVDKPLKQGREARYRYRHLLQLLAVRRLLAEGYSASSISSLIGGQGNSILEDLLQGGFNSPLRQRIRPWRFCPRFENGGNPQLKSILRLAESELLVLGFRLHLPRLPLPQIWIHLPPPPKPGLVSTCSMVWNSTFVKTLFYPQPPTSGSDFYNSLPTD